MRLVGKHQKLSSVKSVMKYCGEISENDFIKLTENNTPTEKLLFWKPVTIKIVKILLLSFKTDRAKVQATTESLIEKDDACL